VRFHTIREKTNKSTIVEGPNCGTASGPPELKIAIYRRK
jgi:hypothetical protein